MKCIESRRTKMMRERFIIQLFFQRQTSENHKIQMLKRNLTQIYFLDVWWGHIVDTSWKKKRDEERNAELRLTYTHLLHVPLLYR